MDIVGVLLINNSNRMVVGVVDVDLATYFAAIVQMAAIGDMLLIGMWGMITKLMKVGGKKWNQKSIPKKQYPRVITKNGK